MELTYEADSLGFRCERDGNEVETTTASPTECAAVCVRAREWNVRVDKSERNITSVAHAVHFLSWNMMRYA